MKIKKLFVLGAMALAGVLTGCQSENKLDGSSLSIDPAGVVPVSAEKQEIVVDVKADCEWVVKCDADWITLSTEGGKGNDKVTLFVNENTGSARETVVHFQKSTTQKVSADLTVKQETGLDIKPGEGTVDSPYLASQAAEICAALEKGATTPGKVYVVGYIKKLASGHATGVSDYGNGSFYITDDPDGTVTPDFYCFQVYYLGGNKFTSADQVKVGDKVVICGQLTHYYNETTGQEAYETVGKGAAYVYSHNGNTEADPGEIEDPSTVEQITCAQFIEKADPNTTYRLVGKVTSSVNTEYCSFDMNDGTGTVVVWTVNNKDEWSSVVKKDGTVTVRGKYKKFTADDGTIKHEMVDAYIEKFEEGEAPDPSEIKDVTVAEFIAAPAGTGQLYRLNGTVSEVINTQYGNFNLTDATGTVLVYGTTNIAEYKDKLLPGATVVVYGPRVDYNGTPEMKDCTVEKMEGGQAAEQLPGEYYPDKDMTWAAATDDTYGAGFAGKSNDGVFTAGIYKYKSTSDIVEPTDLAKVYKSSALVVKTTKSFTKLVLTVPEAKYTAGMTVITGGGTVTADTDAKIVTWEGESTTELVLQASEKQVRVGKFAFNFTEGEGGGEEGGEDADPFAKINSMDFMTVNREDGSVDMYIDIYGYDYDKEEYSTLDIYTAVVTSDKFHANGEHAMEVDADDFGLTDDNDNFTAFAEGGKITLTCVEQAATTEDYAYYDVEISATLADGKEFKKSFKNLEVLAIDFDQSDLVNYNFYYYCMQDEPATKASRSFKTYLKNMRMPRHFVER